MNWNWQNRKCNNLVFLLQAKQRFGLQRWRRRLLLLRDRGQHGQPDRGPVQPHTHLPHHSRPSARLPSAAHRSSSLWTHHNEWFAEPRPHTAQPISSLHALSHPHWPRLPGNTHSSGHETHQQTQKHKTVSTHKTVTKKTNKNNLKMVFSSYKVSNCSFVLNLQRQLLRSVWEKKNLWGQAELLYSHTSVGVYMRERKKTKLSWKFWSKVERKNADWIYFGKQVVVTRFNHA